MTRFLLETRLHERRDCMSPFLVLGDPDFETSARLAEAAVDAGASMLELGIAYDDPCADGPTIQRATRRARAAGSTTQRALEAVAEIRRRCPTTPINMLCYGNLVHARGYERFCRDLADAGASSLLTPDIPHEEAQALRAACLDQGVGWVAFAGPSTSPQRLREITHDASFVYLAATQGVTGKTNTLRTHMVQAATESVDVPVCVGFGLTTPADLRGVFDGGARIAIVGSHLVRVVEHALEANASMDSVVASFRDAVLPFTKQDHESPRGTTSCSSS